MLSKMFGRLFSCFHMDKRENSGGKYQEIEIVKEVVTSPKRQAQQLLPGILDEVTFETIIPKLSWMDLLVLFSVSRDWQQAIKSNQVYNSRARTHSTESLALFSQTHTLPVSLRQLKKTMYVYSTVDKSSHKIPPIPGFSGVPQYCQTVSLDGKLYLMGGRGGFNLDYSSQELNKVYVLDLAAGQMLWKQCASMLNSSSEFPCAVTEGKLYVVGGSTTSLNPYRKKCEVYDPKVDTWTSIKSMPTFRHRLKVEIVGEELFFYGGVLDQRFGRGPRIPRGHLWDSMLFHEFQEYLDQKKIAEVYHRLNDEWRVIEDYPGPNLKEVPEKFLVTPLIGVYGRGTNHEGLWTRLKISHAGSFTWYNGTYFLAVGDKLLAIAWKTDFGRCLLQSCGFTQENKEVLWSEILPLQPDSLFVCCIQL